MLYEELSPELWAFLFSADIGADFFDLLTPEVIATLTRADQWLSVLEGGVV